MRVLGEAARVPTRIYFTGGATAVLVGWRSSTIDVDIRVEPDTDAVFRAIPDIKESLRLNVELASPADFIPVKPGWQDRSPFISQEGLTRFHHFEPVRAGPGQGGAWPSAGSRRRAGDARPRSHRRGGSVALLRERGAGAVPLPGDRSGVLQARSGSSLRPRTIGVGTCVVLSSATVVRRDLSREPRSALRSSAAASPADPAWRRRSSDRMRRDPRSGRSPTRN